MTAFLSCVPATACTDEAQSLYQPGDRPMENPLIIGPLSFRTRFQGGVCYRPSEGYELGPVPLSTSLNRGVIVRLTDNSTPWATLIFIFPMPSGRVPITALGRTRR